MPLQKQSVVQKGYPSVAAFIASSPDLAVFRKFGQLNVRNLLYLQTELIVLESELETLDGEGSATACGVDWRRSWESVLRGQKEEDVVRRKLVLEVRAKLKEYNEALVLHSKVLALEEPPSRALQAFEYWLSEHGHPAMRPIIDRGDEFLERAQDLAALAGSERLNDPLSNFLKDHSGSLLKNKETDAQASTSRIYYFSEAKVIKLANVIAVVLAASLLVGAITSLHYTQEQSYRIGMIGGFTVVFAIGLSLITTGKRGDIFGATAAYAAVLVVYISGGPNNGV